MNNSFRDEETQDHLPGVEPRTERTKGSTIVQGETEHQRLRTLAASCKVFERSAIQDDELTLQLSTDGLAALENPAMTDAEWQQIHDVLTLATQSGFQKITLRFPPDAKGLRKNTAGLFAILQKHKHQGLDIVVQDAPDYFRERLTTNGFSRFVTFESSTPEQPAVQVTD